MTDDAQDTRRAIYAEFETLRQERRDAAAAGDVLRVLEIRKRAAQLTEQLRRLDRDK